MSTQSHPSCGLVLTGGGARAAYQAGALRAIAEIAPARPFGVMAGISAGSINASFLAARADDFAQAARDACDLWQKLSSEEILDTRLLSLGRLGFGWLRDIALGRAYHGTRATHLLDTGPLQRLLTREIDFSAIPRHIRAGHLRGLAISATHYGTGTSVTFFDGAPDIEPWVRSSRLGKRAELRLDHVLASAAIPILFAPVRLEGAFYGDGSIRLRTPLSSVIHLGAQKVLAIGIRCYRPEEATAELHRTEQMSKVTVADIAGVMLNASFMDTLESDVERLERINTTLSLMDPATLARAHYPLRHVPAFVLRPSRDLGSLAQAQFRHFPLVLRHLLNGIGASEARGADLLSYLAFDAAYTRVLTELGYEDAMRRRRELEEFLTSA